MYQLNLIEKKTINICSHPINLEYYLLEKMQNDIFGLTYGVMILKRDGKKVEMEYVDNLSYTKDIAEQILEKLIYCTITPIVMLEVIDDLMANIL